MTLLNLEQLQVGDIIKVSRFNVTDHYQIVRRSSYHHTDWMIKEESSSVLWVLDRDMLNSWIESKYNITIIKQGVK